MVPRAAALIMASLGFVQLTGCSSLSQPSATPAAEQPYLSVDGKRYISGPYGDARDIAAVIATIQRRSAPRQVSVRGVELADIPAYSFISVYRYRFPKSCGAASFQLFEGDGIEILEYQDTDAEGGPVRIRDYVKGPGPFVGPGLWGPYDSTSNAPVILLPGVARQGGMGLMKGAYAIGWMTTLSTAQQTALGESYQRAVRLAAHCSG